MMTELDKERLGIATVIQLVVGIILIGAAAGGISPAFCIILYFVLTGATSGWVSILGGPK